MNGIFLEKYFSEPPDPKCWVNLVPPSKTWIWLDCFDE